MLAFIFGILGIIALAVIAVVIYTLWARQQVAAVLNPVQPPMPSRPLTAPVARTSIAGWQRFRPTRRWILPAALLAIAAILGVVVMATRSDWQKGKDPDGGLSRADSTKAVVDTTKAPIDTMKVDLLKLPPKVKKDKNRAIGQASTDSTSVTVKSDSTTSAKGQLSTVQVMVITLKAVESGRNGRWKVGSSGEIGFLQWLPQNWQTARIQFQGYTGIFIPEIPDSTMPGMEMNVAAMVLERELRQGWTPRQIFAWWNTGERDEPSESERSASVQAKGAHIDLCVREFERIKTERGSPTSSPRNDKDGWDVLIDILWKLAVCSAVLVFACFKAPYKMAKDSLSNVSLWAFLSAALITLILFYSVYWLLLTDIQIGLSKVLVLAVALLFTITATLTNAHFWATIGPRIRARDALVQAEAKKKKEEEEKAVKAGKKAS